MSLGDKCIGAGWSGWLVIALLMALPALAQQRPTLLVLPFEPVTPADETDWIGCAVQQSLVAELSRGAVVDVHAAARPALAVTTTEQAIAEASNARADRVIWGAYQSFNGQLRLTGQVLEVESARVLGGLRATGSEGDLFYLQDELARQASRLLGASSATTRPATAAVGLTRPEAMATVLSADQPLRAVARRDAFAPDWLAPQASGSTETSWRYTYQLPAPIWWRPFVTFRWHCQPAFWHHPRGVW